MTDTDQLRLDADLIGVMRFAASSAVSNGAALISPAHVVLGLLADSRIGPAIRSLVPREAVEAAAADHATLPDVAERDTIAFLSRDGKQALYLDAEAFHLFLEGARRARGAFGAVQLVFALTAEAVKEQPLMALIGSDPQGITAAVDRLG